MKACVKAVVVQKLSKQRFITRPQMLGFLWDLIWPSPYYAPLLFLGTCFSIPGIVYTCLLIVCTP